MKKKFISALLCVAMTASLVVGCGSKSDDKKVIFRKLFHTEPLLFGAMKMNHG